MDLNELFLLGMKRSVPALIDRGSVVVNLGSGNSPMEDAINLDLPEWNADTDGIPFCDESVDTLFAFHFLEHLAPERVIAMLREAERVLKPGGTFNIVVPHRLSQMAFHDLDHKTFFTEETWRTLFSTPYYDKNRTLVWKFDVGTNIIIGLVERNLALLTQLVKKS